MAGVACACLSPYEISQIGSYVALQFDRPYVDGNILIQHTFYTHKFLTHLVSRTGRGVTYKFG